MIRSSPRLPNIYQQFIHLNKYARFKPELGRRETWEETVSRTTNYLFKDLPINMEKLHNQILNCDVMPSMRVMMTAGPALGVPVGSFISLPYQDLWAWHELIEMMEADQAETQWIENKFQSINDEKQQILIRKVF